MKYTNVLSLKYRPQRFADVIGQSVACRILSKASATNAVAPAYILSGTRGVGKTTLARIFAKALLCVHAPTSEPCNECSHCIRIAKGTFVDVMELDAASHRSIDDIRDLRENVGFSPMEGRYKIFILDEAHMLTKEAYNALLKTLEEPPPFVVFIFASTDIQKFPATIISRCQHIVLKSVSQSVLVEHLSHVLDIEGIPYAHDAIEIIARRGFGSVRDSLSLLGQVLVGVQGEVTKEAVEEMLGLATEDIYMNVIESIIASNTLQVISIVHNILEKGIDIKYFLQELTSLCRTLFLVKQHREKALAMLRVPQESHERLLSCVDVLSLQHIHMCWQMILYGQKQVLESVEPSIALELLLLNVASIRSVIATKEYITYEHNTHPKATIPLSKDSKEEKDNKKSPLPQHPVTQHDVSDISASTTYIEDKNVVKENEKEEHTISHEKEEKKEEKRFSIREKMASVMRDSLSLIEGNLIEGEEEDNTIPSPPSVEIAGNTESKTQNRIKKPMKEYNNKGQYPILNIIEEEFNTSYIFMPKSRDE